MPHGIMPGVVYVALSGGLYGAALGVLYGGKSRVLDGTMSKILHGSLSGVVYGVMSAVLNGPLSGVLHRTLPYEPRVPQAGRSYFSSFSPGFFFSFCILVSSCLLGRRAGAFGKCAQRNMFPTECER